MKTLIVPFQIDAVTGGLATTESTQRIVEQQITDVLATNFAERLMNPEYGADLQTFLFSPARVELANTKATEIQSLLKSIVTLADIVSCTMKIDGKTGSKLLLSVSYRIRPSSNVFTMQHTVDGLVTQETSFAS